MKDRKIYCPKCKYDQFYRPLWGEFELKCAECSFAFNRKDINPDVATHSGKHRICYLKAHQFKKRKVTLLECCLCFDHDCEDSDEEDVVLDNKVKIRSFDK